jgi:nucleotide-binding universal stress UspA family protein
VTSGPKPHGGTRVPSALSPLEGTNVTKLPITGSPKLFHGQAVHELLVPVLADGSYERGIAFAVPFAQVWDVPLRLVHVKADAISSTDVDATMARFTAAHPGILADSIVIDAEDVAGGIASAAAPTSLVLFASDQAAQWEGDKSIGEEVARAVAEGTLLCGPRCVEPDFDGSVMVPLDGSMRAEESLPVAKAFADRHGSRIWLVTVVHPQTVKHIEHLKEQGEHASESAYIRSVAERLEADGYNVRWEVRHGLDATSELVRFVDENHVSIVAAASHGSTGVSRRLFGSVSMGLVEQSSVPVMVVKASDIAEQLTPPS